MENPPPLPPTDPRPPPPPPPRRADHRWGNLSNWFWFNSAIFAYLDRRWPTPPGGGWWSRNWKWVVPEGCCLTFIIVPMVLAALLSVGLFGAIGAMFGTASGLLKTSEPYQIAFARAQVNEQVISALGAPISAAGIASGKVSKVNEAGEADLTIPISGPKGKGTIYAVATRSAGKWTYSKLVVKVDATGETIDLGP